MYILKEKFTKLMAETQVSSVNEAPDPGLENSGCQNAWDAHLIPSFVELRKV
jgi:hypothetical protein